MADIKNFGIKGLSSDVQMGKSGGRLKYCWLPVRRYGARLQ